MISIIVPVYNVERYIRRCVDSIAKQSYQDWELILVDDGSPDSSGRICDELAAKDHRIKVVHKQNAGPGSARNTGIENAIGEYILFIDSDDWIGPMHLQSLYEASMHGQYDLVQQGLSWYSDHKIKEISFCDKSYKNNMRDFLVETPIRKIGFSVCKLYRRDIIVDYNIRMDEQIRYGEDALFLLQFLNHANSVKTIDKTDYYYFVNTQSLSHTVKYNFNVEIKCFRLMSSQLDILAEKYTLELKDLLDNRGLVAGYFHRAIEACIHSDQNYIFLIIDFHKRLCSISTEDWHHLYLSLDQSGIMSRVKYYMLKAHLVNMFILLQYIKKGKR
ncbi:MAG: glycosyltransferase family 2 protein [Lachnospiraceae bacterium]|nr:glycosyltransferase family 2 protein [Lachnospiraceae bacterium]